MPPRSNGPKTTKNGRVFVTCTLSPEGWRKMRKLMEVIGATSQGQAIEQSIHRWYANEPLIGNVTEESTSSTLSNVLKGRSKGKKECQAKKIDSGKE